MIHDVHIDEFAMPRILPGLILSLFTVGPALAQEFVPVSDEASFLTLMEGRELRLGVVALALSVNPDGTITGSAAGFDVTGTWAWQDGFFCRQMDWGGTEIPYNCQLVEVKGDNVVRFTVDQGAGDAAEFNLR
jgi:hypothetical protein